MKVKWFAALLCLFFSTTALQGQSREAILKAVSQAPSWTPSAAPTDYDSSTIEKLAGPQRASVLETYGFRGASVLEVSGSAGRVRITLFEMIDSAASYGLFTTERAAAGAIPEMPLGTEGFRAGSRAYFWQSSYLVRLDGPQGAAEAAGRVVSENILGRSQKPTVSLLLPPENLLPGTETYVLDPSGVDSDLGLDPSTLGFDSSVEVATASYRVNGKAAKLVLLLYPTQQIAKDFAEQWDAASPQTAIFRKRVSRLVAMVRGSTDPSVAETILGPVNYESSVTWNEPPPDISLPDLILTIFSFIGVALLFTLIVGISFGGLRVFVKKKYPDRVFDRAQDMEIIQLKLGEGLIRKELSE